MKHPGIILDRDGTLIDMVRDEETGTFSVAFHPRNIRLLPGVIHGLLTLQQAGFVLCIATNQPGPAKGEYSVQAAEHTNERLLTLLGEHGISIATLQVCYHHPVGSPYGDASWIGSCDCRKPEPGMLETALHKANLDRSRCWMVGDSVSDLLAARAAQMRAGLIFSGRCETCPLHSHATAPDVIASNLEIMAQEIIQQTVLL